MLQQDRQISELYYLKNRFNDNKYRHFDWENNILKKTTSPIIWENPNTNQFMTLIEKNAALMIESVNIVRNFFNIAIDKYYNDHWN